MDGFPVHGGVPKLLGHLKQQSHWFDFEDPPKILLESMAVSHSDRKRLYISCPIFWGIVSFLLDLTDMTMGDHHKSPSR